MKCDVFQHTVRSFFNNMDRRFTDAASLMCPVFEKIDFFIHFVALVWKTPSKKLKMIENTFL